MRVRVLWPAYAWGAKVPCFNCNGPTGLQLPSQYATGDGAYMRRCEECALFTYYDITPESNPPYPFCRHPAKCVNGRCEHDPVCND